MLEDMVIELTKNYDYNYNKIEDSEFVIKVTDEVQINVIKLGYDLYLKTQIVPCPEEKKEELFTYLMKANLLGEGTGKSAIGLDNNEKFLTLSYVMPYEEEYKKFKDTFEDFVNYLFYWEEEIKKFQKKEIIY